TTQLPPARAHELLAPHLATLQVDELLARAPIFWLRVRAPAEVDPAWLAATLAVPGLTTVRYVTSARHGSQDWAPRFELDPALPHAATPSADWQPRPASTGPERRDGGHWFLADEGGGIAVIRELTGTAAGTRLAVIDDDASGVDALAVDAEILMNLPRAPRAQSHGALMDLECLKIDSPKALQIHEGMTQFAESILSTISSPQELDMDHIRENIGAIIGLVNTNPAALISLVHLRDLDQYTFMHSVNVSVLSIILGKRLGLESTQLEMLGTGSILHDVGKALVSQEILNKPGKLTDEEFIEMKAHAQRGYEILRKRGADEQVSRIALMHHEKLSGRGYPLGLKAEKVPLLARIVAIADVYDALTGDRVYKKAMHPSQAFGLMEQDVGQHLDNSLYAIFKSLLGLFPVSSLVLLANGSIARVISQNSSDPARPVVEVVRNRYGQSPKERIVVNTASSAEYAITGIHTE
ncbi:MAG TPA: HD-GYP domain-containing protein, partial [Spirochaetota bacterium]|nr:HD-GYP domain-containing protein [Spirochaetota bacterium]